MQDRLLFLSVLCGFSSFCCSVTSEIVSTTNRRRSGILSPPTKETVQRGGPRVGQLSLAKHLPASHSTRGDRASHLAAHYRPWQNLPGASAPAPAARDGVGELSFAPLYDRRGALWRAGPRVRRQGLPGQT